MTGEESQSSPAMNICPHYRIGYCKYKESCKHFHPKENCAEIKCSNRSCTKRHRKPCKFGEKCTRKDSCEFLHDSKKKFKENAPEDTKTKRDMEKIIKLKDAEIEELSEKVKLMEVSIASINEKLKAVSTIEHTNITKDKLNSIEKKVEETLSDYEERVKSVEVKVDKVVDKILRAEKVLIHLKNMHEEIKTSQIHIKTSKGPSLPGPIPDRSTTLPGGATVIPV